MNATRVEIAGALLAVWSLVVCARVDAQEVLDVSRALSALAAPTRAAQEPGLNILAKLVEVEPATRSRPDVQRALARMLRNESRRLRDVVRGEVEDDPYLEQYGQTLIPTALIVLAYATGDEEVELIDALLGGLFDTETKVSRAIAEVGEPAMRAIEKLSDSDDINMRRRSYDLSGYVLEFNRKGALRRPLRNESEAAARRTLMKGLRDPEVVCRRDTIRAIERARLQEAAPLLRVLAETDPDDGRDGLLRFSVRGLAARVLETLKRD